MNQDTDIEQQIKLNSRYYLKISSDYLKAKLDHFINADQIPLDTVSSLFQQRQQAANLSPLPAFVKLSHKLQLTKFEQNILLLCVAVEINPSFAHLYAQAQDSETKNYPTFSLGFRLFNNGNWEAIAPHRPLRYWGLIEILSLQHEHLINCPIKVNERILHFLQGINYVDDRLLSYLIPLTASNDNILSPSQLLIQDEILNSWQSNHNRYRISHNSLLSSERTIKKIISQDVCQKLGFNLFQLMVEQLPTNSQDLAQFIRLWQRESLLFSLALYVDIRSLEGENPNSQGMTVLRRFFLSCQGLFFIDSYDKDYELSSHKLTLEVHKPTHEEQYDYWCQLLGENKETIAQQLTSQFNLNLTDIQQIYEKTSNIAPSLPLLWNECLKQTTPKMDNLAQRIELKATWDDIVLPEAIKEQLQQIVAQIRYRHQVYDEWGYRQRLNRGLGVAVVFAGVSGTGKTMAAEVIANDLQLNLYRIDLSAVVSKYIGETEKNLRKLFDAAEEGGCILFFDEADALFGKRSEVKDSHDRYANIEINYLLQRLESFQGLAILATNKKGSMDTAFMRRLRFIVDFPFPTADIRQKLWKKVFPPATPIDELDYGYLKQIQFTGGSIQNIALNASFLAAKNEGKITMDEVMSAMKSELKKLERSLNELNIMPPINNNFIDDDDDFDDEDWDDDDSIGLR
ncbi:ATP-binding protein [Crocosphaera sp.]|uniref:ATP-binding protein n=1 Tax=Crocosphaera sp. TaxID=2729996 RepID=UPI003F25B3E9|nr:ATP-binding protein [Crocosphaera sp.]